MKHLKRIDSLQITRIYSRPRIYSWKIADKNRFTTLGRQNRPSTSPHPHPTLVCSSLLFQEWPTDELDAVLLCGDRDREPDTARARPPRAAGGVSARRVRRLQGHGPPGAMRCPTILCMQFTSYMHRVLHLFWDLGLTLGVPLYT